MKYIYETYSDIGKRHKNEDNRIICEGANGLAAAVADGLGGYKGGEIASEMLVQRLESDFENCSVFDLEQTIAAANEQIIDKQEQLGGKMKTTVAAVWIGEHQTVAANVGDSRIYAFRKSRIIFQSVDHSVAQMCVDLGEITADQIRSHEDRSVLTRSVGGKRAVKIDTAVLENAEYDSLLLCTDGLWGCVDEEEICKALSESDTPGEWLEKLRKYRSRNVTDDNDNNTAVAIMIKEG